MPDFQVLKTPRVGLEKMIPASPVIDIDCVAVSFQYPFDPGHETGREHKGLIFVYPVVRESLDTVSHARFPAPA